MDSTMNATTSYVVTSVFFSMATIAFALRFYTRLSLLNKFSVDDYFILAGFTLLIPYTAIYIRVIHYLFLKPFTTMTIQDISNIYKFAFIMLPFYLVSSMLVKLSIALRLLKFTSESPILKWIVIFAITIYEADVIVMIAINFTQCLFPIFEWASPFKVALGPHCVDQQGLRQTGWLFGAITCFTDFTLAIVPWFVVKKLWMSNYRMRVLISILLGLGSIASLATIARMFYNNKFTNSPDPVSAGNFFIWSYLELTLAIMACSAATLKPLVSKVIRITNSTLGRSHQMQSTEATNDTVASTWSAYLRNFSPYKSRNQEEQEVMQERPITRSRPFALSQIFSPHEPRVLRHPLSFHTASRTQNTGESMSQSMNLNATQFTATAAFTESDSDREGPYYAHNQKDQIDQRRRSEYNSLEAEIQYALEDV